MNEVKPKADQFYGINFIQFFRCAKWRIGKNVAGWLEEQRKRKEEEREVLLVQACKVCVFKMTEKLVYYPCPKAVRTSLCETA